MTVGGSDNRTDSDDSGKQVAVILSMKEYQALLRARRRGKRASSTVNAAKPRPLYGALRYLGGTVASTEELDATRRELWSAWDKEDSPS